MRVWGAIVGSVVAVVAVVACVAGLTTSVQHDSDPSAVTSAVLDDVPSFGRDDDSVVRDDQIAAYQVYLREVSVQRCMTSQGFFYAPELLYPVDSLHSLAFASGLLPVGVIPDGPPAPTRNRVYQSGLPKEARDSYFEELLGESAEDVDYVETHEGQLPDGYKGGSFAHGGCRGKALADVGRVWDLQDRLLDDLRKLREEARSSEPMIAAAARFTDCAAEHGMKEVTGPESLDEQFASGTAPGELVIAVEKACTPEWAAIERQQLELLEQRFYEEHEDVFREQLEKYGPLYAKSTTDPGFAEAVAIELAQSKRVP